MPLPSCAETVEPKIPVPAGAAGAYSNSPRDGPAGPGAARGYLENRILRSKRSTKTDFSEFEHLSHSDARRFTESEISGIMDGTDEPGLTRPDADAGSPAAAH